MAKGAFKSVDEYIALQAESAQAALERIRTTIRKAVPAAEEMISYQIPTYKLQGRPVLYFAAWKQHYSLYPATAPLKAEFEEEFAGYEVNKGTIRFPFAAAVPVKLIARIAKFRVKELAGRAEARQTHRKRPSLKRSATTQSA